MIEVCEGLAYAHELRCAHTGRPLQIVHRDISPANILISRSGEVKIVDFGLAKAASQVEQTEPGVVKGKFSYLSPEAAAGQELDQRADLFACGALLFEMLAGRRLFAGATDFDTVMLVREAQVPPLHALCPELPEQLVAIMHRALAREPAARYQHAADLQQGLAQLLFARGRAVTRRDLAELVRSCAGAHGSDQSAPLREPHVPGCCRRASCCWSQHSCC